MSEEKLKIQVTNIEETENLDETSQGEEIFMARPIVMMWWKFKKNKMAVISLIFLILMYLIAIFCEFVAPTDPYKIHSDRAYLPPQKIEFVGKDGFSLVPHVNPFKVEYDMKTFAKIYKSDEDVECKLGFFVEGTPYKLWGVFDSNIHLFGPTDPDVPFHPLGTDKMGRDMLSRIIYGVRISTSIGLLGVIISLVLGVLLGGISGYFGGAVDIVIQRIIEFISCIPTYPLWMALSAALPVHWPQMYVYCGMVVILSLVGWTGMARTVRAKFISLREEDFIKAAKVIGASNMRIIVKHMVPSFISYLIASMTLSIPGMILGETSLSYLGLGLREPTISWGVILQQAQNLNSIVSYPWLLLPAAILVVTVLAFNFVGDGFRDAADPYSNE
ncbi:MAG: ABC transporter permease [Clostridia bacterium]|nr:ABC transporter permease [Clostridia bacterium]MBQ4158812.1 ABC transporter permease [Clostridia bacterium]